MSVLKLFFKCDHPKLLKIMCANLKKKNLCSQHWSWSMFSLYYDKESILKIMLLKFESGNKKIKSYILSAHCCMSETVICKNMFSFSHGSAGEQSKLLSFPGNRWTTLLRSIITRECHKMGVAQPFWSDNSCRIGRRLLLAVKCEILKSPLHIEHMIYEWK